MAPTKELLLNDCYSAMLRDPMQLPHGLSPGVVVIVEGCDPSHHHRHRALIDCVVGDVSSCGVGISAETAISEPTNPSATQAMQPPTPKLHLDRLPKPLIPQVKRVATEKVCRSLVIQQTHPQWRRAWPHK